MMSLYSHKMFISKKAVPILGGTEILYEFELCLGGMFVRTFALRRKLKRNFCEIALSFKPPAL